MVRTTRIDDLFLNPPGTAFSGAKIEAVVERIDAKDSYLVVRDVKPSRRGFMAPAIVHVPDAGSYNLTDRLKISNASGTKYSSGLEIEHSDIKVVD